MWFCLVLLHPYSVILLQTKENDKWVMRCACLINLCYSTEQWLDSQQLVLRDT